MAAAAPPKPPKFSSGFPFSFLRENAGIFLYFVVMIVIFELLLAPGLAPLLVSGVRAGYLFAANLNMRSRGKRWQESHPTFKGDNSFLRGMASALVAAAALTLLFIAEDLLA